MNAQTIFNEELSAYNRELFEKWAEKADFIKLGEKTTICLITLENGFEIVGTSACVDASKFDATIGKKYALLEAIAKLDSFVGFVRQTEVANEK